MSRVTTRKRTAPGADTVQIQQLQTSPQMSSNQFPQWPTQNLSQQAAGYSPKPPNHGQPTYNGGTSSSQGASGPSLQNQLSRRPFGNQLSPPKGGNTQSSGSWANSSLNSSNNPLNYDMAAGDELDRKAEVAKREMQANRKQIPPFVQKLSSFLDESRNTDLIRWSDDGDSFIVFDEDEFANTLIPELFKHKKFTSFVRQLNMYGFHKKVGLSDNSMRASERKNKSPSEYTHAYFKRNRPNLLWLIQKPKNLANKAVKNSKGSKQDGSEDETEDVFDIDSPAMGNFGLLDQGNGLNKQPLMIGGTEIGGQVSQDLLLNVQDQLRQVQKTQVVIAQMMKKIMTDHDNLSQTASLFQGLHEKHESSINAILTFLASVYSKNLEGNQGVNAANMFANAIPANNKSHSEVVDMGNGGSQQQDFYNQTHPPQRRQPLLLRAPGDDRHQSGQGSATSPTDLAFGRPGTARTTSAPYLEHNDRQPSFQDHEGQSGSNSHSPAVQEIFDRTPSAHSSSSPHLSARSESEKQLPETDIMSLINAHNDQNSTTANQLASGMQMDFPEALSHLQGGNTTGQLTPTQRDDMLQLMTRNSPNGHDALANGPSPSAIDSMEQYNQTKDDLDFLGNAIREQNQKVDQLGQILAPLSPSGSIPGMATNDPNDPLTLDLDRIFDSSYFNDGLDMNGQPNLDFDGNAFANDVPDFGLSGDNNTSEAPNNDLLGNNLGDEGRVVGSVPTSEGTSPANTAGLDEGAIDEQQSSPRKRQRRE